MYAQKIERSSVYPSLILMLFLVVGDLVMLLSVAAAPVLFKLYIVVFPIMHARER